MTTSTMQIGAPRTATAQRPRIEEIDALRGFALTGLLVVNLAYIIGQRRYPRADSVSGCIAENLFSHRFVTIFCFLFGVSFALVLLSAGARVSLPRLVLLRRLIVLLGIGAIQITVLDGNVQLAVYALLGIIVALPASYLPRSAVLLLGTILLLSSMPIVAGETGSLLKPGLEWSGLLLLGSSVVNYGLHTSLREHRVAVATVTIISVSIAVVVAILRPDRNTHVGSALESAAAFTTAAAYAGILLSVVLSAKGAFAQVALAPMGRMALTNFLLQGVAVMALDAAFDVREWNYAALTFGFTAGVVALQVVYSTIWLRYFRYGPVEWLWRTLTWLTPAPIRRNPGHSSPRSVVQV